MERFPPSKFSTYQGRAEATGNFRWPQSVRPGADEGAGISLLLNRPPPYINKRTGSVEPTSRIMARGEKSESCGTERGQFFAPKYRGTQKYMMQVRLACY